MLVVTLCTQKKTTIVVFAVIAFCNMIISYIVVACAEPQKIQSCKQQHENPNHDITAKSKEPTTLYNVVGISDLYFFGDIIICLSRDHNQDDR
jgi:hypothetical protein